jgi:hypothetical protein
MLDKNANRRDKMVDSVEHRVEMHRIGRERQARGRPRWDQTVSISAYIHEQYSDDAAVNAWHVMRNVADLIAAQMGKFLDVDNDHYNLDFADMIEDMRERSLDSIRDEPDANEAVGGYIDQIYDFFDYNEIWGDAGATKIVKMLDTDTQAETKP